MTPFFNWIYFISYLQRPREYLPGARLQEIMQNEPATLTMDDLRDLKQELSKEERRARTARQFAIRQLRQLR